MKKHFKSKWEAVVTGVNVYEPMRAIVKFQEFYKLIDKHSHYLKLCRFTIKSYKNQR